MQHSFKVKYRFQFFSWDKNPVAQSLGVKQVLDPVEGGGSYWNKLIKIEDIK